MKITREQPSQRRFHRLSAPLVIEVEGQQYTAVDWGLGGFCIQDDVLADKALGDLLDSRFNLSFQGFDISFQVSAKVVRTCNKRHLIAAQFQDLDERQTELMSHFIEDLVRGKMSAVQDTILRIDSPVTPVSMEADPSPTSQTPVSRWPLKRVIHSVLYLVFGIALLLYTLLVLYRNFYSLQVDSGVVSAPIERVLASTTGTIINANFQLKQLVDSGELLFEVQDHGLEELIQKAKIDIELQRAHLQAKRELLALEREKLFDYQSLNHQNIHRISALRRSLKSRLSLAKKDVDRFSLLYQKGAVAKREADKVNSQYYKLLAEYKMASRSVKSQRIIGETLLDGRFFSGNQFEGTSRELMIEIEKAKQEVTFSTQKLLALYQRRGDQHVKAPRKGRVIKLLKGTGSTTKLGETIALFERDEMRTIEAYLTQEEVISVKQLQKASIYFPALEKTVAAQVVSIDRGQGNLDAKSSLYTWRGSQDRTAKVVLNFVDVSAQQIRQYFAPGLPCIVIFEKSANGVIGNLVRDYQAYKVQPQKQPAAKLTDSRIAATNSLNM